MTPNDLLVIFIDQLLVQSSLEKLPPAAEGVNTETLTRHYTQTSEHSSLRGMSPSNPSPSQGSGDPAEDAQEMGKMGTEEAKKTRSPRSA